MSTRATGLPTTRYSLGRLDDQRPRRQRTKARALLALEADPRHLEGRAVHALIGLAHPLHQVRAEGGERGKAPACERIALDVLHPGLRLAFGPRAIRPARAGTTSQSRQKAR